jgi:tetratricopeptide (TPR) repeat protein
MQIAIRSKAAKWLLIIAEIATLLLLIVWVGRTCLANMLASKPTAYNLERAVKLDPGNADYLMRLGSLYEYSPTDLQLGKAEESFRRATNLDPHDPEAWMDLAAALQFQGSIDEAEACRRRVDLLAPNLPAYQWPIANSYLLQGDTEEAFRHFRLVLAGTQQYDTNVFRLAWKATDDAGKILQQLIPERVATEFSYLDFLLAQHRLDDAQAVWKRILVEREEFRPEETGAYIDSLIAAHRPEEAYQVWTDLQKKGLIRYWSAPSETNLISDGDFEDELLNFGFAWRVSPVEGVYAGLDTSNYHSPSHALLIQFSGKENLQYQHVYQFVKVTPGQAYHLQALMKTENITTDSGPCLEVYDAYSPATLDKSTEELTGSSDAWTPLLLDFVAGPKTDLLVLRLKRSPSRKLDNLISGKVWLDDVQLTPVRK